MKNYYIYHIPGIKIGCTVDVPHRMREQGFTEWEHLETHTDIYEASDREIQLQKDYGLPIDTIPYWKSVQNRPKWNCKPTKECKRLGGSASGAKNGKKSRHVTFEIAQEIRSKYVPRKYTIQRLANEYVVSTAVVKRIVNNITYLTP
tara:strand:+ start:47 stop:487 length:441 start_codon:yes stop_codon:yes gene_type:complete